MTNHKLIKYKQIVNEFFANGADNIAAWKKFHPDATDKSASSSWAKMVKKQEVQEYINKCQQAAQVKSSLTQDIVIAKIINVYDDAMRGDVIPTRHGDVIKKDRATALRALELIGKHIGLFELENKHLTINYNDIKVAFVD